MGDYGIFLILGALVLVYFAVLLNNRKGGKKRKSRKFMDGKRRPDR